MTDFKPLTKEDIHYLNSENEGFPPLAIVGVGKLRSAVELLRHYLKHSALYHKSGNHIIDVAIDEAFPVFIKESNEEDKK